MVMRKWRVWLKKKISCDKDTSILSSLPVSKPISYYSIMLKKHQSWYKSDNFGNSLLQGNITQMWGGWGRGDFQISPLSERWPQVSNGCPSEIHYTEKQNIPQQPDLEIYLTSSKTHITILCRHQQLAIDNDIKYLHWSQWNYAQESAEKCVTTKKDGRVSLKKRKSLQNHLDKRYRIKQCKEPSY